MTRGDLLAPRVSSGGLGFAPHSIHAACLLQRSPVRVLGRI